MRAGDRLRLGATVALELGSQSAEGERRAIIIECEPDDILLSLLPLATDRLAQPLCRRPRWRDREVIG